MTSLWAWQRLKSPASRLFTQPFIQTQIKENIKAPHTGLCAGNSPGTGEFPAQIASNTKNVSIWWRHDDSYGNTDLGDLHLFETSKVMACCLIGTQPLPEQILISPSCQPKEIHLHEILMTVIHINTNNFFFFLNGTHVVQLWPQWVNQLYLFKSALSSATSSEPKTVKSCIESTEHCTQY